MAASLHPPHPYFPQDAVFPAYLPNSLPVVTLLAIFSVGVLSLFALSVFAVLYIRPKASYVELVTVLWFVLSGSLHIFFEGYFVYNFSALTGRQDLFGQLWKEYALSDSRYLTQEPMVLCLEIITVLCWGPLSLLTAALIATDHVLRHPFQIIVSMAHVYGDTLYYATAYADSVLLNKHHTRPEPYYYWGYYVGMNAPWIIIPLVLLYESITKVGRAFVALKKMEQALRTSDVLRKVQ